MNKTYFTPECKVIKIQTFSILADARSIEFDDSE